MKVRILGSIAIMALSAVALHAAEQLPLKARIAKTLRKLNCFASQSSVKRVDIAPEQAAPQEQAEKKAAEVVRFDDRVIAARGALCDTGLPIPLCRIVMDYTGHKEPVRRFNIQRDIIDEAIKYGYAQDYAISRLARSPTGHLRVYLHMLPGYLATQRMLHGFEYNVDGTVQATLGVAGAYTLEQKPEVAPSITFTDASGVSHHAQVVDFNAKGTTIEISRVLEDHINLRKSLDAVAQA